MNMKQAGFTLIELVMVIVILGILAAVAIPKFIDLSAEAKSAAVKGVAGGVSSAFATNYAAYAANSTKGVAVTSSVQNVQNAATAIMAGGMPTGYTATAAAATVACGTAGAAIAITVQDSTAPTPYTAPATLICTG